MTVDLTAPEFHDEAKAREWLEGARWPTGTYCCHCGSVNVLRMEGKAHRPGLFHCRDCRGQFTVLTGSVMERSHIPLPKWVLVIRLMTASKKGISAHQVHRMINIGYKSAWFMCHRIREAMREVDPTPLGGEGKIVEADEMYHGKRETPAQLSRGRVRKPTKGGKSGPAAKREVIGLVERGGEGRMIHVNHITAKNLREHVVKNVSRKSKLHTDESRLYDSLGYEFRVHEAVHHASGEYARGKGDNLVTTNTVEGMFGIFKRGMTGVYQHCGEQHLQRYLDEFTFRWNNRSKLGVEDQQRAKIAAYSMGGKRLTYRRTDEA
jgi:transposase-like protein